jgi:hypothetical protein
MFYGSRTIYFRVTDFFTNLYSSINVPGFQNLIYCCHPVDRQGWQPVKSFIPAAFKTKKLGHIQPLVIYDLILMIMQLCFCKFSESFLFPLCLIGSSDKKASYRNILTLLEKKLPQTVSPKGLAPYMEGHIYPRGHIRPIFYTVCMVSGSPLFADSP